MPLLRTCEGTKEDADFGCAVGFRLLKSAEPANRDLTAQVLPAFRFSRLKSDMRLTICSRLAPQSLWFQIRDTMYLSTGLNGLPLLRHACSTLSSTDWSVRNFAPLGLPRLVLGRRCPPGVGTPLSRKDDPVLELFGAAGLFIKPEDGVDMSLRWFALHAWRPPIGRTSADLTPTMRSRCRPHLFTASTTSTSRPYRS
jgi:hypothetical protein